MNTQKLRDKMAENRLSVEAVSNAIGINRGTFYRKLNSSGVSFTVGEANKMRVLLKLSNREAARIFFD